MKNGPILLVEDNPEDLELALRALKSNGLANEIVVARDGAEAIRALGLQQDSTNGLLVPELVVLDIQLPKINGLEVLRRMRANARTQFVPVVFLTSSQEQRDLRAAYGAGANSFLVKSMDPAELKEAMHFVTQYWLRWNFIPT